VTTTNQSTIECGCGMRNYLDPYTFLFFEGNVSCAGCDKVYYIEKVNNQMTVGPEDAREDADTRPPGFAEHMETGEYITTPPKVAPPVLARAGFDGKCRELTTNVRGNLQAGKPLTPEELTGSIWTEIYNAKKLGNVMS
jgi:hypothetical protein